MKEDYESKHNHYEQTLDLLEFSADYNPVMPNTTLLALQSI